MTRLFSLLLAFQLVLPVAAFAEWEIIDREGERFALIPAETVVKIVRDLGDLDALRMENVELKSLVDLQEEQMSSIKIMLSNQDIRNELFKQREMIYTEQTTYLTDAYTREIEENERLRLDKPSPLRWALFGGVFTVSMLGFTSWMLGNVK